MADDEVRWVYSAAYRVRLSRLDNGLNVSRFSISVSCLCARTATRFHTTIGTILREKMANHGSSACLRPCSKHRVVQRYASPARLLLVRTPVKSILSRFPFGLNGSVINTVFSFFSLSDTTIFPLCKRDFCKPRGTDLFRSLRYFSHVFREFFLSPPPSFVNNLDRTGVANRPNRFSPRTTERVDATMRKVVDNAPRGLVLTFYRITSSPVEVRSS